MSHVLKLVSEGHGIRRITSSVRGTPRAESHDLAVEYLELYPDSGEKFTPQLLAALRKSRVHLTINRPDIDMIIKGPDFTVEEAKFLRFELPHQIVLKEGVTFDAEVVISNLGKLDGQYLTALPKFRLLQPEKPGRGRWWYASTSTPKTGM